METTGCRPTAAQELMLRAALLRGDASRVAWEAWKAGTDIDRLDPGSFRLLPLLYRSLQDQGIEDPLLQRLKGVSRQTWYKNQLLFGAVTLVLRSLQAAGIKTMLLKGAALVALYYRDDALRPMNDFDILVPLPRAMEAVGMMQAMGWKIAPGGVLPTEETLFLEKSHEMRSPEGHRVDLHWHVLEQWFEPESEARADDAFWRDAIPMMFRGVETHTLCPADLLMNVCVHATEGQPDVPPVRWVADALTILNSPEGRIDWNRFLSQARQRRVSLPLNDTARYLADEMQAPIPKDVLQKLAAIPTTREQEWEYIVWTAPPLQRHQLEHRRHALVTLRRHYRRYARWAGGPGHRAGLRRPLSYLQHVWCLETPWHIPLAIISRGFRKVPGMTRLFPALRTEAPS